MDRDGERDRERWRETERGGMERDGEMFFLLVFFLKFKKIKNCEFVCYNR